MCPAEYHNDVGSFLIRVVFPSAGLYGVCHTLVIFTSSLNTMTLPLSRYPLPHDTFSFYWISENGCLY